MINPNDPTYPAGRLADPRADVVRTDLVASNSASAVSWGAILAGAAGAAALSLILLILGTGLGLSSVSPWVHSGVSATTFGVSTILWITFTQLAAAGLGGYLAGRLRKRWLSVHTDEVYFRDTAHGFLSWSIATLATAALLTSTIGSILGGGAQLAAGAGGVAAVAAPLALDGPGTKSANGNGYFVDQLFRGSPIRESSATPADVVTDTTMPAPAPSPIAPPMRAGNGGNNGEAERIFVHGLVDGDLASGDAQYLANLVAQRTGLSQAEATQRVNETYAKAQAAGREAEAKAKAAADEARKASAYAALWLFVSLLIGAFVASWFATFGGRQRDA